jgi:hypothetical protein
MINLLLLASTLCAFNSMPLDNGTLCYRLQDSAYTADYQGMKQEVEAIEFNADGTIVEAITTQWNDPLEMQTFYYTPNTGCRTWYGENENESSTCQL